MSDKTTRFSTPLLLLGLLGCLCMGGSDWLMIYGDTAYTGALAWLTEGVAAIPPGRNALALALALPAVVFYCIALLGVGRLLPDSASRRTYGTLTTLGMTPWLALHLFYVMILFLFGWLRQNGLAHQAHPICEGLFGQFSWLVLAAEVLMLLPFLYLTCLIAAGRTALPRWMAVHNPLVLFAVLKLLTAFLPDVPARLAFTNGLMSEAMAVWFLGLWLAGRRKS